MAEEAPMTEHDRRLATYGSDLSRWPDGANEARKTLLGDPEFRRAWAEERDLDRKLVTDRAEIDTEIALSGALDRIGRLSGRYASAGFIAGIPWRRVAAGVILAGVLGGALDYLVVPQLTSEPIDLALIDPLGGLDAMGGP
jgi:hypothetical protein